MLTTPIAEGAQLNVATAPKRGAPTQTLFNVQILRLLAALVVVLGHALHELGELNGPSSYSLWRPIPWGFGVDIFFVISGFIMFIVARDSFGSLNSTKAFLARRLERIAPLYWIFTTLALAMAIAGLGKARGVDWGQVLASYLFFPVFRADGEIRPILSVGWTLNYEMLFYALFAASMLLRRRAGLIALSLSLCALAALGPFVKNGPAFLIYWTSPIILEFGAGLAIGYLYHKGARVPLPLAIVMAVAGVALAAAPWPPLERALICGGPAALIVAAAALGSNPARLNGVTRPLVAGGDASYAIYLSHIFTINACSLVFAKLRLDAPLLFLSAALLGSITVGVATRLLIEKPILRWSRTHGLGRIGRRQEMVSQGKAAQNSSPA